MSPWSKSEQCWLDVIAESDDSCLGQIKAAVARKAIEHRLTKVQVMIQSKIPPTTVANIFKYGNATPKLDTVQRLAEWAGLRLVVVPFKEDQ